MNENSAKRADIDALRRTLDENVASITAVNERIDEIINDFLGRIQLQEEAVSTRIMQRVEQRLEEAFFPTPFAQNITPESTSGLSKGIMDEAEAAIEERKAQLGDFARRRGPPGRRENPIDLRPQVPQDARMEIPVA